MSKRTEVGVFESAIAIPGCRFTRNALIFEGTVDEQTLKAAGAFLQAVDACAAWWWGDFLVAYCGYSLKKQEREEGVSDQITREERLKQYTAHFAQVCGREPSTLYIWRAVAEFFNFERRRSKLSYAHHHEAMWGSGRDKPDVADKWLDLAIEHSWSKSELRAAIRRAARAAGEPEEPMPAIVHPLEMVAARRYAVMAMKRVDAMSKDEVEMLLMELAPLVQLAKELQRRIAGPSQG